MSRIPNAVVAVLRTVRNSVDFILTRVVVKSGFLSSLYYTFFSRSFYKEHRALIAGRIRYAREAKGDGNSSVLLRRNVHRMEKGLIMRPRRPIFARSYIIETVAAFEDLIQYCGEDCDQREELQWAHDVLAEYFSITDVTDDAVNAARKQFESLPPIQDGRQLKPYVRDLEGLPPVDYESMLELAKRRRSVRWYDQRPVARETIDKAMVVAGYSPSACNRQPFEFRIVDAPDKIAEISSIPMGTKGFNHNFPGVIAVVGRLSAYFHDRDKHVIYIDASLAAMSFLYALETLGVASCIINWPDIPKLERKMEKALELRADERVVMLISYGHPDPTGMVPYSQKKNLKQLRRYN